MILNKSNQDDQLFAIATEEDIFSSIPYDFSYKIDKLSFANFGIKLLQIKVEIENICFELQPILVGNQCDIFQLSKYLWKKIGNAWQGGISEYSISRKYSLKNNILIPAIVKLLPTNLGVLIDIGSFSTSILKSSSYRINKIICIDYIKQDISDIGESQSFLVSDSAKLSIKSNSIDSIICSMSLLNFIYIYDSLFEINRVLKNNGVLIIADINSNYYKATGVFFKKNNLWKFRRIIFTDKIFFTLKNMSKTMLSVHCYHQYNLYTQFLISNGYKIENDFSIGSDIKSIKSTIDDSKEQKRIIKKMEKDITFPCFHLIKANKKA